MERSSSSDTTQQVNRPTENNTTGHRTTGNRAMGGMGRTRKALNVPLLVGTLIAVTVFGGAAYFWRDYQVGNVAEAFLQRADALEAEEDYEKAVDYIHSYLRVHPDDAAARVRLAKTYDKFAVLPPDKPRAIDLYSTALGVASKKERPELRRRLVELRLDIGRYPGQSTRLASAAVEARRLANRDAKGWRLLAIALYRQIQVDTLDLQPGEKSGRVEDPDATIGDASEGMTVDEVFRRALELNPGDIELSRFLAGIYRDRPHLMRDGNQLSGKTNQEQFAEWIADQIRTGESVALNDAVRRELGDMIFDRIVAGEKWAWTDDVARPLADWAAEGLDQLDLRLLPAWSQRQRASLADRCMTRMIEENPKDPDAYLTGYSYKRTYRQPGGEQSLLRAMAHGPDNVGVLMTAAGHAHELGNALLASNVAQARAQFESARALYERVITIDPKSEDAYVRLAVTYSALGEVDRTIRTCRDGLRQFDNQSLRLNLAHAEALIAQGRLDEVKRDEQDAGKGAGKPALDAADATIRALRSGLSKPKRDYWKRSRDLLEAQWHMKRGNDAEAVKLLGEVARGSKGSAREARLNFQANVLLAGGPDAPGYAEKAEAAGIRPDADLAKAASLQRSQQVQRRLQAAEVWMRAGQPGKAIAYYKRALALDKQETPEDEAAEETALEPVLTSVQRAEARFALAEAQFPLARQLDTDAEIWRDFGITLEPLGITGSELGLDLESSELDSSDLVLGESWRLRLLVAEAKAVWGNESDRQELAEVWKEQGLPLPMLRQLVRVYRRLGLSAEAASASERLETLNSATGLIWEAAMYRTANKLEDAEKAIRKAVHLAPADPRTMNAQFQFFVGTNQIDRMHGLLKELVEKEDLTDLQLELTLARGCKLLGNVEQAEAHYRKVIELVPEDDVDRRVGAMMALASAVDRSDRDKAEKVLNEVLELKQDFAPARQRLAFLKMQRGGSDQFEEGASLLDSPEDRRSKVVALAARNGRENLEEARRILEELIREELATGSTEALPADRVRLAGVYERLGDVDEAREQYRMLLAQPAPNPELRAEYVDMLLRNGRFDEARLDEADAQLKDLEKTMVNNLAVVTLRARWLDAKGRTPEITRLVEPLAERLVSMSRGNRSRQTQFYAIFGNLYSTLTMPEAAEHWHQRLFDAVPTEYGGLAISLARQGRSAEVINLCKKAVETDDSPRPAIVLALALAETTLDAESFELAESVFDEVAIRHSDDVDFLFSLGNFWILRQKNERAVDCYERILKSKPMHLNTLNNLATLLGEQEETMEKAEKYIKDAIDFAGPQPGFLDTKATNLIIQAKQMDDPAQAVPLLKEAVSLLEFAASSSNPDPRYDFHLAMAYLRDGKTEQARQSFEKARNSNLGNQILTETDQQWLPELEKELQ